ncbi:hypothetical protein [Salipiger sp.]|uniref:hypothetical protein n=1 Tax=Salipiger sp. TaxID=2078585 RepID=UPI003A969750
MMTRGVQWIVTALFVRTFDDAGNAGLLAFFFDERADFDVFEKKITVVLVSAYQGCPRQLTWRRANR